MKKLSVGGVVERRTREVRVSKPGNVMYRSFSVFRKAYVHLPTALTVKENIVKKPAHWDEPACEMGKAMANHPIKSATRVSLYDNEEYALEEDEKIRMQARFFFHSFEKVFD